MRQAGASEVLYSVLDVAVKTVALRQHVIPGNAEFFVLLTGRVNTLFTMLK
jgi:hypothetical protein